MKHLVFRCAATLVAAVCLASPVAAQAGAVAAISGGGIATFDLFPGSTIFSVQARISPSGAVRGHFACAIPGVVVIVGGDLTSATRNPDGSITLAGLAHGFDAAVGVFTGMPFEVRLWSGGPGVGRFIYDDPVVGTPAVSTATEGDRETVASGHIRIVQ
jgi:hypothetical protein